jgi:ornithine--oxo-acid transaminase
MIKQIARSFLRLSEKTQSIAKKEKLHSFSKLSEKTQRIIQKEKLYNCNNYEPIKVVVERAEGSYVYDVDNKKYLDCISGYSALNQGHLHPRVKKAIIDQLDRVSLTSRAMFNDQLGDACEFLCKTFSYEKAILMNTGVEAGETAIKFARKWGYERKGIPSDQAWVLFAFRNFWGRTMAACGSSEDFDRYNNFGPFGLNFELINYNDLNVLEDTFKQNKNIAAYMMEPIQGEGGVIIPDPGYLRSVRELCDRYNVLLIFDEVQTGLGRTGRLLCQDHEDVKADLVCLGKALSAGFMPVSAVLGNNKVFDCITPGTHGSTFGGNPLACVTMIESVKVLIEENMIENSKVKGDFLIKEFKKMLYKNKLVKDIRGKGLFIGVELDSKFGVKAKDLVYEFLDHGLLTKDTRSYVLRLAPALNIGDPEVDLILKGFEKVFRKYE